MIQKSALLSRLRKHFGTDPDRLPVIRQDVEIYERPNLHLAVAQLLDGRPAELTGIVVRDVHIEQALTEFLVTGGELTKSLLGASSPD